MSPTLNLCGRIFVSPIVTQRQLFDFGRVSLRMSRNSFGPLRSRRFRSRRSSAGADGSISLSICSPAPVSARDKEGGGAALPRGLSRGTTQNPGRVCGYVAPPRPGPDPPPYQNGGHCGGDAVCSACVLRSLGQRGAETAARSCSVSLAYSLRSRLHCHHRLCACQAFPWLSCK